MAKKEVDTSKLTAQEFRELVQVMKDIFLFSTFISVVHPMRGKVPFNLYPYQRSVLYQFLANRFNIVLKFRQAGITELISMYCLWLTMYHPNKKVNIISIKDTVAKKVLKKIKYMYKNLPKHLQTPIVNGRTGEFGTSTMIEFSNGSYIESIPTTEEAGRSEALTLLVIDEAAIVRWASTIWASSFPTLSCAIYDTPIMLRKKTSIGNIGGKEKFSYDTKIKPLGSICPNKISTKDISKLGYYTLTHTGKWQLVTHSQNKGKLETWYVEDNLGNIGGYTPAHRLYTTKGWKTVKDIINKGLNIISVNTNLGELLKPPTTKSQDTEVILPIPNFPRFLVSNLGKVYKNSKTYGMVEVKQRPNKFGYLRVNMTNHELRPDGIKHKSHQIAVSKLVYETFVGDVPKGLQVDHIDCNRINNTITNLQLLDPSDNVSKSFLHNLNAKLTPISGSKLPDLLKRGRILELREQGKSYTKIAKLICPNDSCGHKFIKRIFEERSSRVYISKLRLIKKTLEDIYDIQVEGDHSYISANNFINHNTGGSAILNSTPYGIGNFYHSKWVEAITNSQENVFNAIRLRWQMHPERDEEWYQTMSRGLGAKRTAQEIDGDFLSSGNTVFDLTDIKAIEECLSDYKPISTKYNGQLRLYNKPDPNKLYSIGADVATGRGNDYSAFTLGDRDGEEAGCFKGRIPVRKYANLLGQLGMEYNQALLAPETNDIGLAVTSHLQDDGYPNLYYFKKLLKKKGKKKPEFEEHPGWLTLSKNRSLIIDELEEDIRKDNIICKDMFFVNEAHTFIYDGTGKPIALGKGNKANNDDIDTTDETYSDDSIFGKAIWNHVRKGHRIKVTTNPK